MAASVVIESVILFEVGDGRSCSRGPENRSQIKQVKESPKLPFSHKSDRKFMHVWSQKIVAERVGAFVTIQNVETQVYILE